MMLYADFEVEMYCRFHASILTTISGRSWEAFRELGLAMEASDLARVGALSLMDNCGG